MACLVDRKILSQGEVETGEAGTAHDSDAGVAESLR